MAAAAAVGSERPATTAQCGSRVLLYRGDKKEPGGEKGGKKGKKIRCQN